jgi:GT2 family glycosyltransferase
MSRVYVIIVNWNGWRDTIECLESLFRSDYDDYRVIVCDNGSTDGSIEHIKAWAEGRLDVLVSDIGGMRTFSYPPVGKPLLYSEYTRSEAERGGTLREDSNLILVDNGANLGFAGGNNVGLRYALARADFKYAWLLNNDTIVATDALSMLVRRMEEKDGAGMCGSTIRYYGSPGKIQALGGGYYCKWIGLPWHYGRFRSPEFLINTDLAEKRMNYVEGASLFVSRSFLHDVGLICEEYFLYFEETDWALRANGRYSLAYSPESTVYHKVGSSIGTSSNPAKKSFICDYFNIRNRLYFTRKFYPVALPAIYLTLCGTIWLRIVLRQWDRVAMIIRTMFNYKTSRLDELPARQR